MKPRALRPASTAAGLAISLLMALGGLTITGCSARQAPRVENVDSGTILPYKLQTVTGTRDGDKLGARCVFTGSDGSFLLLQLMVQIENPPRLAAGTYKWQREGKVLSGAIEAESLDFLGGQSDPPSLGGRFKLAPTEGAPALRVTLPLTPVAPAR